MTRKLKKSKSPSPELLAQLGVVIKPFVKHPKHDHRYARDPSQIRKRICVTLDPQAHAAAADIGGGNVSRGIDKAVFFFVQTAAARKRA